MSRNRENCRRRPFNNDFAPSRSCTLAAVTTTVRSNPRVSTKRWRLRPLTCLCVSPRTPFFRGLDRLAVDDPGTGLAVFPARHPHIAPQQVVHERPGPVLAPDPKVVVDNLPRREVMR